MRYNPRLHHRRSIRLPAYDYTQAGAYFVTVCTHNREPLFADRLVREIVADAWRELARRFPYLRLDQFIVMPNHIHAILWVTGAPHSVRAQHDAWPDERSPQIAVSNPDSGLPSNHAAPPHPTMEPHLVPNYAAPPQPTSSKPNSLGLIVRAFKSRSAKRVNRLRRTPGAPVWQRNYYEHIVRGDEDLCRIRQYIIDNPAKWTEDADNPTNWPTQTPERYHS